MEFCYEGKVLWSQIDANVHLRHSAYADFAAQARLTLLEYVGLDSRIFKELGIGPVLFREELQYLREIEPNDTIKVKCQLVKMKDQGSRWSFRQEIFRGDGVKAAIVNVDGAWIDINKRKLTSLPSEVFSYFDKIPKSSDFSEE